MLILYGFIQNILRLLSKMTIQRKKKNVDTKMKDTTIGQNKMIG